MTQPRHPKGGPGTRAQVEGPPAANTGAVDDFDTLLATLRTVHHRDLAEAMDDTDLRERLSAAETVVEKLGKLARSLVEEEIRESQYINRTLRLVGFANE